MAIASAQSRYTVTGAFLRDLGSTALKVVLAASLCLIGPMPWAASADRGSGAMVRLEGHLVPALTRSQKSTGVATSADAQGASPMMLTVVLNRDDEAGFQQYLSDVYNPASPAFRHFLAPSEIAARFGPSQQAYDAVLAYLNSANLELSVGSANRLTLVVQGARSNVEQAFSLHIDDYDLQGVRFFANDVDPALPSDLAPHVQAVSGLSNLAIPVSLKKKYPDLWAAFCGFPGTSVAVGGIAGGIGALLGFTGGIGIAIAAVAALVWGIECYIDTTNWKAAWAQYNSLMKSLSQQADLNMTETPRKAS